MGTLLEPIADGIAMVKWDPYMNTPCQTTMSGAAASDLEEVASIPRCKTPTLPGMYLLKRATDPRTTPEVAILVPSKQGLYVSLGFNDKNGLFLSDIETAAIWWGPIEAL